MNENFVSENKEIERRTEESKLVICYMNCNIYISVNTISLPVLSDGIEILMEDLKQGQN